MALRVMATFEAKFAADGEFPHPEGCYLARKLERACREPGFAEASFDNWRDCGWYVSCLVEASPTWICFARYTPGEQWQLFVESRSPSGFIARLLGKAPVTARPVHRLASVVEAVLRKESSVSALHWSLTADPRKSGVQSLAELQWPENASA